MTRDEAIKWLEETIQDTDTYWESCSAVLQKELDEQKEVFLLALSALRPVSRELVEKVWRGEWIYDPDTSYMYCEICKHTICQTDYLDGNPPPFCEMCGAPMTDEAVEMVMERLEAMKDGSTTD